MGLRKGKEAMEWGSERERGLRGARGWALGEGRGSMRGRGSEGAGGREDSEWDRLQWGTIG